MNNIKYDAIIIGAGIGGLTTGATLAKAGKKVLVLEQHNIVGGCATVYKRRGSSPDKFVKFEVGLHEMDWADNSVEMKHVIFKKLGLYKKIKLISTPQFVRIKSKGMDLEIPEGHKEAMKALEKQFPSEKAGIRKYFAGLKRMGYMIRRVPYELKFLDFMFYPITTFPMHLYQMFTQKKTSDVMNSLFKNDKLKRVLNANIVYYHDNPYEFGWYYHACAQGAYYNSAKFVRGGSQELSNALADIIKENGGEVKTLADVKKINLKGNKATGVTYVDRKTKEEISVDGKYIVSNASPYNVYNELLPKGFEDKRTVKLNKEVEDSVSLYTVYIIFKEKLSKLYPGNAYSTFMFTEKEFNAPFSEMSKGYKNIPIEERGFVLVDYSTIDSGLTEEDDPRSFGVFTGASFMSDWENLTTEEYKAKKTKLAEDLIDRAEKYYPGIREHIDYYEVATPKTIKRYIKTPSGVAYGYKQNGYLMGTRAPRMSNTVKNLHFTGAWTFPGGGFTGALLGGYLAGKNILFPINWYVPLKTLLCTIVGTSIGTAHLWLPSVLELIGIGSGGH